MRRAMLTLMAVVGVFAATSVMQPQQAQAAWPGYFSFSVGSPYGYGVPGYGAYPYAGPPVPQPYFSAGVPLGGFGYGGYPYGASYGGFYGRPGYAPTTASATATTTGKESSFRRAATSPRP